MYLLCVADGDRQSIGGIVGLGHFRQAELEAHHLLNLLLAAGAVVGDPLLDLRGGVFKGGNFLISCGEEGDGLRTADSQRCSNILSDERLLHGNSIGLVALDYFEEFLVKAIQSFAHGGFFGDGYRTEIDQGKVIIFALDNAPTHHHRARVDA